MALGITAEHRELAQSVRDWAARHVPAGVRRAGADGPAGPPAGGPDRLLGPLAAQGLLGLPLPEGHGGQGYRIEELAIATEELGRALAPGAFLPTVLASAALMADGAAAGRLGKVLGSPGGGAGGRGGPLGPPG